MVRKKQVSDLFIFGGSPTFQSKLYVGLPSTCNRDRFLMLVNELLDREWLTNNGPFVQELEQNIAAMVGVRHCLLVSSGTMALEIVVRAAGLSGEVIVPSLTFIATAHALLWQNITPIFCDIDPETYNIDPSKVEALITPQTSGIIGVHLWGRPCDVDSLGRIASENNLKIIYDAAHAFGCSHKGRSIGTFGDAEIFSFHASKFFNTLEGGAVLTNDDGLAQKVGLMRNFGLENSDHVVSVGTNGKMNEISAAMGLTLLESLDTIVEHNFHNYKLYQQELEGISGIKLIIYDESERNNYQYIVIEVDDVLTGVTRDQLLEILWGENIMARRYFYPGCHRSAPYNTLNAEVYEKLPVTELLSQRLLCLPTGLSIGFEEIRKICRIIRLVIAEHETVNQLFQKLYSSNFDTASYLQTVKPDVGLNANHLLSGSAGR